MGSVLAGLQANVAGCNQTARWAERDTAARHEVLYGDRGKAAADDYKAEIDVPDIRLGDEQHNYPAPVIMQSSGANNGLLTLALGAILGGGGIALGQFLAKPAAPAPVINQQQPATDTATQIGLGRITDLEQ